LREAHFPPRFAAGWDGLLLQPGLSVISAGR